MNAIELLKKSDKLNLLKQIKLNDVNWNYNITSVNTSIDNNTIELKIVITSNKKENK